MYASRPTGAICFRSVRPEDPDDLVSATVVVTLGAVGLILVPVSVAKALMGVIVSTPV